MKLTLPNNWIAKALSLLLATAIWFLIKEHLATFEGQSGKPLRARIVEEPLYPPKKKH
jgi:hypothetical protein